MDAILKYPGAKKTECLWLNPAAEEALKRMR